MEYLIQESTLAQIAEPLKGKFIYKDIMVSLLGDRSKIMEIELPEELNVLRHGKLFYCDNLTEIKFYGSQYSRWSSTFASNCPNLRNLRFCNNNLRSVALDMFTMNATSFENIYLYQITPPTWHSIGNSMEVLSSSTIHVPIGSGDAYKSATNWSSFADNIVEDIEVE